MEGPRNLETPLLQQPKPRGPHVTEDVAYTDVAPILSRRSSIVEDGGAPLYGEVRLNQATAALAATIIGAGIMALPRAFATLGLVLGGSLLAVVFGLSLFSLSALIRAARSAGRWTYADLAESQFGTAGATALTIAILLNNSGSMIIYLIIIGDVLCGVAPEYRQAKKMACTCGEQLFIIIEMYTAAVYFTAAEDTHWISYL